MQVDAVMQRAKRIYAESQSFKSFICSNFPDILERFSGGPCVSMAEEQNQLERWSGCIIASAPSGFQESASNKNQKYGKCRIMFLEITFPQSYPFQAPLVRFLSNIGDHPNVDKVTGLFKSPFLDEDQGWSPCHSMIQIFEHIYDTFNRHI